MNKKKLIFFLFIFIIVGVFVKFNNNIISYYILAKLSKWTERTVTAKSVDIDYFKGKIDFYDLKFLNKPNFYDKNIFETKKLSIEIKLSSIFSDLVKINKFTLHQPRFFFEIRAVTEKKETLKDNIDVIEKIINQTPPKIYPPKKNDKNFIILNLNIINSKAFIRYQNREVLIVNLSNMSFQNVGNTNFKKDKNYQHYKDIMKIIMGDIYFRIPDMELRKFIKEIYKIK